MSIGSLIYSCFLFLVTFQSLVLHDVADPDFSYNYLSSHLDNLTCSTILVNHAGASTTPLLYKADVLNASFNCSFNFSFWAYTGKLFIDADVNTSTLRVNHTCDSACETLACATEQCTLDVHVEHIYLVPPSPILDTLLDQLRGSIENGIQRRVCEEAVPALERDLLNHTELPLAPVPAVAPGPPPLASITLFRAVRNILQVIPPIYGLAPSLEFVTPTTAKLSIRFTRDANITFNGNVTGQGGGESDAPYTVGEFTETFMKYLNAFFGNSSTSGAVTNIAVSFFNGLMREASFQALVPANFSVSLFTTFSELRCDDKYQCSVAAENGIVFSNLRLTNGGDVSRLMNKNLSSVQDRLNEQLSDYMRGHRTGDAFLIPMKSRADEIPFPSRAFFVALVVLCALGSLYLVRRSLRRHAESPIVCRHTQLPLSRTRILVEDAFLCASVSVCFLFFVWSNTTTAAYVVAGSEMKVYSFSLMGTARDLWDAGLKPLSFCVFLFSGVYPYCKLACIILYTLLLQRPNAVVLEVMDLISRFSLIDTFVMVIMVSGLTISGVVDVHIGSSFYLFAVATLGSIALGNFATTVWRRDTSLHDSDDDSGDGDYNSDDIEDEDAESLLAPPSTGATQPSWGVRWPRRISLFSVGSLLLVAACTLPSWQRPSLSYYFGGIGPAVTEPARHMSLYQLSSASGTFCFLVVFLTVIVAPCLLATTHPSCAFVASWCAPDVFLLACVGGLLQLNQFVQFILGSGTAGFYSAHAKMRWPLYLLGLASIWTWTLSLAHLFKWNVKVKINNVVGKFFTRACRDRQE